MHKVSLRRGRQVLNALELEVATLKKKRGADITPPLPTERSGKTSRRGDTIPGGMPARHNALTPDWKEGDGRAVARHPRRPIKKEAGRESKPSIPGKNPEPRVSGRNEHLNKKEVRKSCIYGSDKGKKKEKAGKPRGRH